MMPVFPNKPEITWTAIKPLVLSGDLAVLYAWCYEHNKVCQLKEADEHVSGIPCPQWISPNNNPVDLEDAECALTAGIWISHRRKNREKKPTYENVLTPIPSDDGIIWLSVFTRAFHLVPDPHPGIGPDRIGSIEGPEFQSLYSPAARDPTQFHCLCRDFAT